MFQDKTLVCKECGNEFVFTAGEQEFYAERGFQNEPQRCKACRDARKNASRGPRGGGVKRPARRFLQNIEEKCEIVFDFRVSIRYNIACMIMERGILCCWDLRRS